MDNKVSQDVYCVIKLATGFVVLEIIVLSNFNSDLDT